jgi:hypothetical protein
MRKNAKRDNAAGDSAAARRCLQDSLRRLAAAGGVFAAANRSGTACGPPEAERVEL